MPCNTQESRIRLMKTNSQFCPDDLVTASKLQLVEWFEGEPFPVRVRAEFAGVFESPDAPPTGCSRRRQSAPPPHRGPKPAPTHAVGYEAEGEDDLC